MLKKVSVILLILFLIGLITGCEEYDSASIPMDTTSSIETILPTQNSTPDASSTTEPTGHIHSYLAEVVPATCTEEGYMVHTCDCGDSFVDGFVPANGHDWSVWVTVTAPTETETGLQRRECSVCFAEDLQVLDALGQSHSHSFSATIIAPGCTEQGYTAFRCTCGEEYVDDYTAALGHQWSNWTYEDNYQTRTCNICGASDTIQSSHTHSYSATTVPATCTEGGYQQFTCSCGDSYRESETEPTGHSWGQWQVTLEPTTEAVGEKQRVCESCGEIQSGTVQTLPLEEGFIIVDWTETVHHNEKGSVCIKGQPGVEYTITVYYKSGPASAAGLDPAIADADGYVTWTWKVSSRTIPGTYEIVITGGGVTQSIFFTIVPNE